MYRSLHIERYRGFQELELQDLRRINLITGRNSVGKTNLLEAFALHAAGTSVRRVVEHPFLRRRIPPRRYEMSLFVSYWKRLFWQGEINNPSQPLRLRGEIQAQSEEKRSIETLFHFYDEELQIGSFWQRLADFTGIPLYENPEEEDDGRVYPRALLHAKITDYASANKTELLFSLRSNRLSQLIMSPNSLILPYHVVYLTKFFHLEHLSTLLSETIKNEGFEALREEIKFLSIFVDDMQFFPETYGQFMPYIRLKGMKVMLPLSSMGEGFMHVLYLLVLMRLLRGGILLVDEITAGLHYSVLADFWRKIESLLTDYNVQLIATTHSYECVGAAYEGIADKSNLHLYRLQRSKQNPDRIEVVSYGEEDIDAAMEFSAEVR